MNGEARIQYLEWLKSVNPVAYATVMREAQAGNLNGMGGIWDSIVDATQKIIPGIVQAKAQRDIYKMQMQRAQQGLKPLDVSQIAPVIRTQVDVAPATRNAIMAEASAGIRKMMIPAAIGFGAIILILVMRKKK